VLRAALADEGLAVAREGTHIVPLVVGGAAMAVAASDRALEQGVFAQAIRPPTVPEGTSRLRLAVMASHTKSELRAAARTLAAAAPDAAAPDPAAAEPAGEAAGSAAAAQSPAAAEPGRVFDQLADAA
jgi:glycine C-acetyltransferase/8-amino-7-oxononanoate synthase